jgi:1-deoxyxylulose-5-phosphate synthase
MRYVNLGRSGLKVSPICLGMMLYGDPRWESWAMDEDAARPIVKRAIEKGINYFDTANNYSNGMSEVVTGRLLKEFARREEVVIATKVFNSVDDDPTVNILTRRAEHIRPNRSGLSRKHIHHAVDDSLRRLEVDYIDLYQIHRFDYSTPVEETMEALHDVVKAGKVRYLGGSSMFAWQFAKMRQVAKDNGWTDFISMQNHYNLVYREEEREMNPLCHDQGIGLLPWSPLARGFLAGNRKPDSAAESETVRARTDKMAKLRYYRPEDFTIVAALSDLSKARGISNATLALAWLLSKNVTAPIIGASKSEQIDQAIDAIETTLDQDEVKALERSYIPHSIIGHV